MKKRFINFAAASTLFFAGHAFAQQKDIKAEAVIRSDGNHEMRITDVNGKVTTLVAKDDAALQIMYLNAMVKKSVTPTPSIEAKPVFISHEALLRNDGGQEIRLKDQAGKETVIVANKGESLQEKYWAFLKKENLPCACSPSIPESVSNQFSTRTAIRDQNDTISDEAPIIAVKVCLEGGVIKKGDLLIQSSKPGIAMKADPVKLKPGQIVIGKALEDYNTDAVGIINIIMLNK